MLKRAARTFLVFAVSVQLAVPQVDGWERVGLIRPGKSVSVSLKSGTTVRGKMSEFRAEGLSLVRGKRTESFLKDDIARVHMVAGMSRGRRAAWAFGIGAAVGAGVFGAAEIDAPRAAIVAWGAVFVGGIAAGIAALIPQHKELIYQAPTAPGR